MHSANATILTINGGSSSIKFAVYQVGESLVRTLEGKVDRIGSSDANLTFNDISHNRQGSRKIDAVGHASAVNFLLNWIEQQPGLTNIMAIGHRIVHGMQHTQPERISEAMLDELHRISAYDPEHLPRELELIKAFRRRNPQLLQVACFDTAFHQTLPRVARLLPIPRRYADMGIQRYGFHGLSYTFLMQRLAHIYGTHAREGRVILAHLGNGASLAAVRDGRSIDTSMGFTPTGGVMMGTRSGDLDPGVAWYIMQSESLSPEQFNHLVNHESGLLGISETSADMRDLIERETADVRAAEAVAVFCYQIKKCIGAYTAALSGLDTLVFTGGIGENAPAVRARICSGLGHLGIDIDAERNLANADIISTASSRVIVRVMPTDEELIIAQSVLSIVGEIDPQGV